MRDIAILILIFVLFLLALKSRKIGMYTYWWFAVFRPHDWVYMDIGSLKLPMIATVLFILPAILQRHVPRFDNSLAKLILFFFILQVIATALNGCSEVPIFRTSTLFAMFLLFLAILISVEVAKSKRTILFLLLLISLSIGFHSGKAGLNSLTGADYSSQSLIGGFLSGSNALAFSTGIAIFYMLFCFNVMTRSNLLDIGFKGAMLDTLIKLRYLFIILIPASFLYIMASQSRGSFLGTSLGLVVYLLLQKNKFKHVLITLLIASIAISFIGVSEEYQTRIMSAFAEKGDLDKSAASRPHFWGIAVEIAKNHPVGVGTGCYPAFYNNYDSSNGRFGYFRSVHSSHFQVLSDIGYLGFVIWLLIFFIAFRKLWLIRKHTLILQDAGGSADFNYYLSNSIICILVLVIFSGSFYEVAYNDLIWLTFACIIALENRCKENDVGKSIQLT